MITLTLIFVLMILFFVLFLCLRLAGGVLKIALKLIFCLPCAIICGILGVALCCTLILIPVGILCFKLAGICLNPFKACFV